MRYKWGLDVCHSGPYAPVIDHHNCKGCETCVSRCPVNALNRINDRLTLDKERCLGCGVCSEFCPNTAISMTISNDHIPSRNNPGLIRMLLIVLYMYLLTFPSVAIYKLLTPSQQYKDAEAKPRDTDSLPPYH
jgi:ferredoxin